MDDNKEEVEAIEEIEEIDGIEIISGDYPDEPKKSRFLIINKIREFKSKKIGGIIWQVGTSLLMLALAAGVGIFLAVGTKNGSPEHFGQNYFDYYANRNWYNMYQNTEIEESEFINFDTFKNTMNQFAVEGIIEDYEFEVVDEKDGYAYLNVNYTLEAPDEEETTEGETFNPKRTYSMVLKEQEEKILMFYSTWKGSMMEYIIENCTIEIPSVVTPTFDGSTIEKYKISENEETGTTTYKLDRVFIGEHTIELTGDGIDTITAKVDWSKNSNGYSLNRADLKIKEEHKAVVNQQATDIVLGFYSAALANGDTAAIKGLITESEAAYLHIDEQFAAMLGEINMENGRTLMNMEIESYECEVSEYDYMNNAVITFKYIANYTARGERSVIDGVRRQYNGTNSGEAKVYFTYTEEGWKAVDVDITCIDYSVEAEAEV